MDQKVKILFYGDSPSCATGFGTVARNILVPLYNTGKYDITVLGVNYWGMPHKFPFPIWPVGINDQKDPYGRQRVQQQIAASEFDILFMIQDSFILEFVKDFLPQLKFSGKKFKSVVYFPIDGVPKSSWVDAMSVADYPVTYTKFGFNECIKACPTIKDKLHIIPHGANIEDFHPLPYGEVMNFRNRYFGPVANKFIVMNLNRNQVRKDIPRTLMAFAKFHKKYPESVIYAHMATKDQGWNLEEVVKSVGLVLHKDVVFPQNFNINQGYPLNVLNLLYNASDLVVSSTLGEGWGLSTTETMAAKKPILFPDNTACTEIVTESKGGLLIKSGHDMEHFTVLSNDNEVVRPLISIEDMADKLEILYNDEALCMELGENGYKWVHENLVWEKHIVPKWENIIDSAVQKLRDSASDELCYDGAMEV